MTEYVHLRSTSWYHGVGDFANIFKAFIGTNYLSLAYGFKQSGLALGIAGLILISLLTGYCCQLIVTCKHIIIDRLCEQHSASAAAHGKDATTTKHEATSMLRLRLQANLDYADLGRLTFGRWGAVAVNVCLVVTQLGFCVGYFIFIGNTLYSLLPTENKNSSARLPTVYEVSLSQHANESVVQTGPKAMIQEAGPSLALLVLAPLPLLIAFTMFRNVRQMAPFSIMANIVILIGLFSVLFYIVVDFHVSHTVVWMRWATLPVFFGQINSAYEAIGLIIPIESSMHSSERRFPGCLCGAMFVFTCFLAALAIAGYVRYGDSTRQIISQNLASDHITGILINVTLIFGVLCTYPLQVFPVVEIFEGLLFTQGKPFGPEMKEDVSALEMSEDDDDATQSLLKPHEPHFHLPVAQFVPKSVAAWKRNLFRCFIAVFVAAIAVTLRRVFAYVGALVGAIGSCPLAFILPCLFHLRLRWRHLSVLAIARHFLIIVLGACASVISFIVVLMEIFQRA